VFILSLMVYSYKSRVGESSEESRKLERKSRLTFLYTSSPCGRATLRQSPWLRANDFSLTVRPEVRNHADDVVETRVGALVEEQCAERAKRVDDQARLNRAVQTGAGE
jgi:hypothetical protein